MEQDKIERSHEAKPSATESKLLLAAVGATDLAVEKVRVVVADTDLRAVWKTRKIQDGLQRVPAVALGRAMAAASKAESEYEQLAERGRVRVDHLRDQESTQKTIARGRVTLARTQTVIADGRRGMGEALASVRQVVRGCTGPEIVPPDEPAFPEEPGTPTAGDTAVHDTAVDETVVNDSVVDDTVVTDAPVPPADEARQE